MKYLIAIVAIFIFSGPAYSAGTVSGKISSIQARETGYIEITFEQDHSNPDGCGQKKKVVVPPNHIAKNEIVSFSLAAMAQGKQAAYWVSACYSQYSTSYPIAITGAITSL